jgi:hypothetical protein
LNVRRGGIMPYTDAHNRWSALGSGALHSNHAARRESKHIKYKYWSDNDPVPPHIDAASCNHVPWQKASELPPEWFLLRQFWRTETSGACEFGCYSVAIQMLKDTLSLMVLPDSHVKCWNKNLLVSETKVVLIERIRSAGARDKGKTNRRTRLLVLSWVL